jgi:hypothetical protein
MSTLSPKPSDIPRSPRTIAVLRDDGTGELTINGVTQPLKAPNVDEARALVLERVSAHAHEDLGGPVRLLASDPDGWWDLAVYPDGHVSKIASHPPAAKATIPARTRHSARGATSTPRRDLGARTRIVRRAGALVALLSVIASAAAIVLSTNGDTSSPAGAPARPLVLSQTAASAALAAARRDAARRAELQARRERAAKLLAAREQAIGDRAARRADVRRAHARAASAKRASAKRAATKRAAAKRAAAKRAAARRAAAKRAAAKRAAAGRRSKNGDSAPASPTSAKPGAPPPTQPSARPCGQFDLC